MDQAALKRRLSAHKIALTVVICSVLLPLPHAEVTGSKPSSADIPAARMIADPFPVFNGIAVDPDNNLVLMSDPNRKSLLTYDRSRNQGEREASVPLRLVIGPETYIGMVAGVLVDPEHHEIYTANNDIEDTVVVMSYTDTGNAKPKRVFSVPHQAWGLAMGRSAHQLAVTVEIQNAVVFYDRDVRGVDAPLRVLRGSNTGLADPHGIYWDEQHNEVGVANHGNFRGLYKDVGYGCVPTIETAENRETGEFQAPSITVYSSSAQGNAKPLRTIQGSRTELDWPMGIAEDPIDNTIVVAGNGNNSILVFDRNASGNAAPVRVIHGDSTRIRFPMGLAVDQKNHEIWVANYGDHSALAFDANANGNVAPKRIIRSAPEGTPTPGFGNPMALAYDCKREQILVPN